MGTETDLYMLSEITAYNNNIDGLHDLRSTPQYGFVQGMKEFGQEEYNATVSELSNKLTIMDAVDMLDKRLITSNVYICECIELPDISKEEENKGWESKRMC